MSLDKAIEYKKEKRGPRRKGCGRHCSFCFNNRIFSSIKAILKAQYDEKEILQKEPS
jgi:hypothetical protein